MESMNHFFYTFPRFLLLKSLTIDKWIKRGSLPIKYEILVCDGVYSDVSWFQQSPQRKEHDQRVEYITHWWNINSRGIKLNVNEGRIGIMDTDQGKAWDTGTVAQEVTLCTIATIDLFLRGQHLSSHYPGLTTWRPYVNWPLIGQ